MNIKSLIALISFLLLTSCSQKSSVIGNIASSNSNSSSGVLPTPTPNPTPVISPTPNPTVAPTASATSSPSPTPAPTSTPISGSGIKWHPGHYGLALSRYSPNNEAGIRNQWKAVLNSDSRFVGVNGFYSWYNIEPKAEGQYDFSAIDGDIAWLNANFPGKKLLIEVWSRDFSQKTVLPSVPQDPNNGSTSIPDYILTGNFTGSGGQPGATWNANGRTVAFWNAAVLKRYQALDAALAAHYDNNPTVEAIKYDEYSPPVPSSGAPSLGYSAAAMISSWEALHTSMAANWKKTNKVCMANWPMAVSGGADASLFTLLKSLGVAAGGPDIMPPKSVGGRGETWGAQILSGAGGVYGTVDYRKTLPVIYLNESPQWMATQDVVESYSYDTLQATHVGWLYNPTNIGSDTWAVGAGSSPWLTNSANNPNNYPGVLDTLKSTGFRIHSACPTVYGGQCNTK